MIERRMDENFDQEHYLRLAEALAENVSDTPAHDLLSEVAEDFGNPRELAHEFDRIFVVRSTRARFLAPAYWRGLAMQIGKRLTWPVTLTSGGALCAAAIVLMVFGFGDSISLKSGGQPSIGAGQEDTATQARQFDQRKLELTIKVIELEHILDNTVSARGFDWTLDLKANQAGSVLAYAESRQSPPLLTAAVTAQKETSLENAQAYYEQALARLNRSDKERLATLAESSPGGISTVGKDSEVSDGSFIWPAKGQVIETFSLSFDSIGKDGISIALPEGTAVRASLGGVISYAGNDFSSFGQLVLARHTNGFLTVYAHGSELLVKVGDEVRRGQAVMKSGHTGDVSTPQLYFAIRKGSRPLDPMQYLSEH